jgi:hypothetical protein
MPGKIPPDAVMPIILTLGGICLVLLFVLILVVTRLRVLSHRLSDTEFQNRSLSTTYGRITEQWFPLLGKYPYDAQDFRFLGSPIDGVQFEEDRIVFVEFKANKSRLSEKQRRIKKLVEEGYVYWEEFHFTDDE